MTIVGTSIQLLHEYLLKENKEIHKNSLRAIIFDNKHTDQIMWIKLQ
jgi:hypothetical protein